MRKTFTIILLPFLFTIFSCGPKTPEKVVENNNVGIVKIPLLSTHVKKLIKEKIYFCAEVLWDIKGEAQTDGNNVVITFFPGEKITFNCDEVESSKVIDSIQQEIVEITIKKNDIVLLAPTDDVYSKGSHHLMWTIYVTSDKSIIPEMEKYGAIILN